MLILGIDTSLRAACVCLMRDGEVLVDYTLNNERTHSEKLMEMIDDAYRISKTDIKDTDAFALACGPGSFTGLRIGAATIKGLAEPLNKPVYLTSSLEAVYEAVRVTDELPVCVISDAGRNEVYCAVFDKGEYVLKDCCMDADELFSLVCRKYKRTLFTGDGVIKYKKQISETVKDALFCDNSFGLGRGSAVIRAALKYEPVLPGEVAPVYLKASQAERLAEMKQSEEKR